IYVLPGGKTLFQQLAAALVTPQHQPPTATAENDMAWWRHAPVVGKKEEVLKVGYLYSLTFPARRVRLHPTPMDAPCTRCGQRTEWGARTMIYEMGESRPKSAALWRDPFAAYRTASDGKTPTPVRPVEGRAVWREYANILLPVTGNDVNQMRPAVINQLQLIRRDLPYRHAIPFKVVGVRTDMKMKIFEWEESEFELPAALIGNVEASGAIRSAIEFATECDRIIKRVFRAHFGGDVKGGELNEPVKWRMSQSYWERLAPKFRRFVRRFSGKVDVDALKRDWARRVVSHAQQEFKAAIARLPKNGATLRQRIEGEAHCRAALRKYFNKQYPQNSQ
ncbi:MAG: type I-E CRISPR-associated protein Cse1/CasA, partial [Ardenticatenaceae bacterium]